jgi:poly(3-hydroxybutyrate) depolymerase
MLYHLYETQRAALMPVRVAADQARHLLRNPLNPASYTYPGRVVAAACDVFEHATRRYGKPEFELDHTLIDGAMVPVQEQIVLRKTFGQLKRFKRATSRTDPRLLIVAPLSGHFATLLRGTVEAMLPDHDVYITDWRDARNVPLSEGHFDLDDYIDYLIDFLHLLGPNTHVMAVCQPSVPVLAAVSIMAAQDDPCVPPAMVLMGGPIDTREAPTEVNLFGKSHPLEWFERHLIQRVPMPYPGFMRQVYPGFLQLAGFMGMNYERHVDAHREMFHHLVEGDDESAAASREFYEEYRAVMDMTAEFYLQTLVTVFREHLLPRGAMVSRGRKVDPAAITRTALMTVEGERDDISGLGQTRAAHRLCRNLPEAMRLHYEQKKVGHYGIFNGRKWREQISPRVKAFIRAHDQAATAQTSAAKAVG